MDLRSFADLLINHRARVTAVVVAFTAIALVGLSRLGFEDNPRGIFRTDDADFALMEEIFEQFGTDENNAFLIVTADPLFSRDALTDLRRMVTELPSVQGIESVTSLADERLIVFTPLPHPIIPADLDSVDAPGFDRIRTEALSHPLVAGQLVNDRGNGTLVIARIAGNELSIEQLRPVHNKLTELAQRFTQDSSLDVRVTGLPAIRIEAISLVQEESSRFTVLCVIAAFVMAVALLRRWQMVLVVCAAPVVGTLWTVGMLGLIGEDITVLTVVLPMLVMVIGFTDSVHLIIDIRNSRASGLPPLTAAREALRHLTIACGLTSLTTAVGFASLAVSHTDIIRRFGLACGMGAVITFIAVILIVPLLAATRLGWGMLPSRQDDAEQRLVSTVGMKLIDFVIRIRWPITIGGILLSIYLAWTTLGLHPENELTESLPDDSPAVESIRLIDREFGGFLPSFVIIDWPKDADPKADRFRHVLEDVHTLCQSSPATNRPLSLLNVIQALPPGGLAFVPESQTRSLIRYDLRRAVVISRSPSRSNSYYYRHFPQLAAGLAKLESRYPGFRFRLTGSSVVFAHNLHDMIEDLLASIGLASIVIFATLVLAFRSLRTGLICVIPNLLPLLFTAALLAWSGQALRISSVIVFCVCLGIAVDDTIHFVNRFQRERRAGADVDAAIRNSFHAVGTALVITTLVLVVGFSITLTSAIPGNRLFGLLSCIAIASALLGDLIILPAMLSCFAIRKSDSGTDSKTDVP